MGEKWKFQKIGGVIYNFPLWWGYGYFLELHNSQYVQGMQYSLRLAHMREHAPSARSDSMFRELGSHYSTDKGAYSFYPWRTPSNI